MASHRKSRRSASNALSLLTTPTARAALTVALAGAASLTSLQGSAQAATHPAPPGGAPGTATVEQVKSKVDRLQREVASAQARYQDDARRLSEGMRDENGNGNGTPAGDGDGDGDGDGGTRTASNDPSEHVGPSEPSEHTAPSTSTESPGRTKPAKHAAPPEQAKPAKPAEHTKPAKSTQSGKHAKPAGHKKPAKPPSKHAAKPPSKNTAEHAKPSKSGGESGHHGAKAGTRAGKAVSFARKALGKPYVWGATGPSGYDCSGLTQAAWKAAGVSLPRTTYSQIGVGKRVARSQLRPGDLVFFYNSRSHVGIYVGKGRIIHAPRPGSSVRVSPMNQMPFAGATRPG